MDQLDSVELGAPLPERALARETGSAGCATPGVVEPRRTLDLAPARSGSVAASRRLLHGDVQISSVTMAERQSRHQPDRKRQPVGEDPVGERRKCGLGRTHARQHERRRQTPLVSQTPCVIAHGVVEVWPLQSTP